MFSTTKTQESNTPTTERMEVPLTEMGGVFRRTPNFFFPAYVKYEMSIKLPSGNIN